MGLGFLNRMAGVATAVFERMGGPKFGGGLPVGVLPPPFEIGNFISTLHQPDGSTKLDTIIVIQ